MLILLPPSEGKSGEGDTRRLWTADGGTFGGPLGPRRTDVADRLAHVHGGNQALLGVKGVHLERARAANAALVGAPTLPAWRRYTGVVWDHLDLPSFDTAGRRAAVRSILIPSGLAGLTRADDPLPDYRLRMGARLAPFGTMSLWWREAVTAALAAYARGRTVIDLLPQEHRGAIDTGQIAGLVRVDLVSRRGGTVGGHNAKAAKGLLARHLLQSHAVSVERRVASFRHDEYVATICA